MNLICGPKIGPKKPLPLVRIFRILFWGLYGYSAGYGMVAPFIKDPHSIILGHWPQNASSCLMSLVPETATHHSHYFPQQDASEGFSFSFLMRWIHQQFFWDKQTKFSLFLVMPWEIPAFLSYIDEIIRQGDFLLIDYGPWHFIFKPATPFKKRPLLGVSFYKDPLSHKLMCFDAPCIKVVRGQGKRILSIYPVTLTLSPCYSQESFQQIIEKLISSSGTP